MATSSQELPLSQSIQLKRLSSTIHSRNNSASLYDGSFSQTVKLPALNAINRSVKYNDLSFATTRGLNKLRKEPQQPQNIEEEAAHSSLMVVRKKYDNMNKVREQRQKQIQMLETERMKFQTIKDNFLGERSKGEKKVVTLEEDLSELKGSLEQSQMQRKVMLSMIGRIKSDKVVYDLRKFNLQKELVFMQKQKQIIIKQSSGMKQEQDRTKKVYSKLMQHLEEQSTQREEHLNSVIGMLQQKKGMIQHSEQRKQQMQEIAELTLQDKDAKQKNWYKVHLCHKFVQKMLRDKMTREMIKFNTVEMAFKNIKTATGVTNSQELVVKFLNKEKAYGELLGKIAEDQRQIGALKSQKDELEKQNKKLKEEKANLKSNKREKIDLTKQEKEMQFYSAKLVRCNMHAEKLKALLSKNIKKFDILDNKKSNVEKEQKDILNQFKDYLQRLSSSLQAVHNIQDKQVNLQGISDESNIRIRLNEPVQQIKKQKNHTHVEVDQDDFLNHQRNDMIHHNQKFMKELKKKYEQAKKAQIQAQPKRKDIVIQKPKAPPVESQ